MPEPSQTVVVNATPVIALALINQLDLLRRLYGEALIPPAVRAEVLAGGPGSPGFVELQRAEWIRVTDLQDPRRADLLSDLDRGEAEVIALAQELNATLVIVDERLARRHVRRLGLKLTGTLGVLLKAKERGLIPVVSCSHFPTAHCLRSCHELHEFSLIFLLHSCQFVQFVAKCPPEKQERLHPTDKRKSQPSTLLFLSPISISSGSAPFRGLSCGRCRRTSPQTTSIAARSSSPIAGSCGPLMFR